MFGHPTAEIFGYSHLTDEQVLFLSDILPTGHMGAKMCDLQPGDVVAVWGAGPVGQFARDSARVLGAELVIAIDKEGYRLDLGAAQGYATVNFDEVDVRSALLELTGGWS